MFGIVLTFFAQMDAYSRLQNYKLAKDLFFEKGFQKRIANLFIRSRCQREAIKIAAIDLGIIRLGIITDADHKPEAYLIWVVPPRR